MSFIDIQSGSSASTLRCFYIEEAPSVIKDKFSDYYDLMSLVESTDNPDAINFIDAMGLFGFMPNTLSSLGYNIDPNLFKINPETFPEKVQREVMTKYTIQHYKELKSLINEFSGKMINDTIKVTPAGMLAVSHLSGIGGLKKLLLDNVVRKDTIGTTTLYYMWRFQNIKIR